MVRVGGFLKTQNRIRRQRARGRFISPYQVGGHDLWQVHDGALSLDAYLLPLDGPARHGEEDGSICAPDERGGSQKSVMGQPSQSQEATDERGQRLPPVKKTHPNRFSSSPLSRRASHT